MAKREIMSNVAVMKEVSKRTGYGEAVCSMVATALTDVIIDECVNNKTVIIDGFGSFYLKFIKGTIIKRHHVSGEPAIKPDTYKLTYKCHPKCKKQILTQIQLREYIEREGNFIEQYKVLRDKQ